MGGFYFVVASRVAITGVVGGGTQRIFEYLMWSWHR